MDGSVGAPGSFPRTAAVIGLGMIGGSLGLRLRSVGVRVLGVDVDPNALEMAAHRGAIDAGSAGLDCVAEADLVIVATPLDQVAATVIGVARRMRRMAVLTDVGSVKAPIVAAVEAALAGDVQYVGGHPMAGNEGQGMAAADAALLDGRPFVLTPTALTSPDAVTAMQTFVLRLGMRPVILDPVQHDEMVAQVSHLPYLISLALHRTVAADARAIGGPAHEEMTRIARSPANMWTAICRTNRDAILRALARYETELARLRRSVEDGKPEEVIGGDTNRGEASVGEEA